MARNDAPSRRGRQTPATGSSSGVDVETLRAIVEMVEKSDITRLEWQKGDERLLIRRGHAPVYAAPAAPQPVHAPAPVTAAP
ncbi:MAG: acetyl-CoA carboxylase, biotin carboxyl carrier protein, partial [Myxococcales bacterium]